MHCCRVQSQGRRKVKKKKSEARNWETNRVECHQSQLCKKMYPGLSDIASNFPQTHLSPFHAFSLCHLYNSHPELQCSHGPLTHANSWPGSVLPASLLSELALHATSPQQPQHHAGWSSYVDTERLTLTAPEGPLVIMLPRLSSFTHCKKLKDKQQVYQIPRSQHSIWHYIGTKEIFIEGIVKAKCCILADSIMGRPTVKFS